MNDAAADLLDVRPGDEILEIGFGPGRLIHLLACRGAAFVAGVDPSDVMVREAARLNGAFIAEGRVELKAGVVSQLPYEIRRFSKVCAVNVFELWPESLNDLREVRRVMKHDGLLLLGLRIKDSKRRVRGGLGFTDLEVREVQDIVERAGFWGIRIERRQFTRDAAAYVLARR